jgi:hypothetical protein
VINISSPPAPQEESPPAVINEPIRHTPDVSTVDLEIKDASTPAWGPEKPSFEPKQKIQSQTSAKKKALIVFNQEGSATKVNGPEPNIQGSAVFSATNSVEETKVVQPAPGNTLTPGKQQAQKPGSIKSLIAE